MKLIILELALLGSLLFPTFSSLADEQEISQGRLPIAEDKKPIAQFIGEISAYTLGREEENDDTPCIGAFNENLCESYVKGELLLANNYYLPGTRVCIEGVGCGRVADRMNPRYDKDHFDIAGLNLKENLKFGRQKLLVKVYKR